MYPLKKCQLNNIIWRTKFIRKLLEISFDMFQLNFKYFWYNSHEYKIPESQGVLDFFLFLWGGVHITHNLKVKSLVSLTTVVCRFSPKIIVLFWKKFRYFWQGSVKWGNSKIIIMNFLLNRLQLALLAPLQ